MQTLFFYSNEAAKQAEKIGRLDENVIEILHREKFFKLFIPELLGGRFQTFQEALQLEESLAHMDGSLGWTVTLCAGAGWFMGFLESEMREELTKEPKLCLAGSGFVGGKAEKIKNNYRITGSWTYASGALHASHFTANCELFENGKVILDSSQKPIVKAFILRKSEVEILDSWNYMGMIATGSHAFRCEELLVPAFRSFEIVPEKTKLPDPIFQYPFLQFAEATLAVNILGISTHLQELIVESFTKRNEIRSFDKRQIEYFKRVFKKESEAIQSLRNEFYQRAESSWEELIQEGKITDSTLKKVSKISRKLTQKCRESNARLYPFAGLEAAKTHTGLNRVWRDFYTVSQHALFTFPF